MDGVGWGWGSGEGGGQENTLRQLTRIVAHELKEARRQQQQVNGKRRTLLAAARRQIEAAESRWHWTAPHVFSPTEGGSDVLKVPGWKQSLLVPPTQGPAITRFVQAVSQLDDAATRAPAKCRKIQWQGRQTNGLGSRSGADELECALRERPGHLSAHRAGFRASSHPMPSSGRLRTQGRALRFYFLSKCRVAVLHALPARPGWGCSVQQQRV